MFVRVGKIRGSRNSLIFDFLNCRIRLCGLHSPVRDGWHVLVGVTSIQQNRQARITWRRPGKSASAAEWCWCYYSSLEEDKSNVCTRVLIKQPLVICHYSVSVVPRGWAAATDGAEINGRRRWWPWRLSVTVKLIYAVEMCLWSSNSGNVRAVWLPVHTGFWTSMITDRHHRNAAFY